MSMAQLTVPADYSLASGEVLSQLGQSASTSLEAAFTELVEQYSSLAFNVALRMLHDPTDAEDAAQEAFISAYKAFPKFKGESKVSTWFYRIVVNVCLMKIRKDKSRANYLTQTAYDEAIVPSWKDDPEDAAVNGELRAQLEKGLQLLPPQLRTAVVLRDVQGFTTDEAAEVLGVSISSLKARLHRGRILLRKHLEGYLAQSAGQSKHSLTSALPNW